MTTLPLASRVALVTGGGKGLGASIATRLAKSGAKVAVLGRDRAAVEKVAHETRGLALVADATDAEATMREVARAREALGPIGILVNNAGIALSAPLERTDDAAWDQTMAINVTAAFRLVRALVPDMVKSGWGRVVNVSSNAGLSGYAYTSAYCASKHAMIGMTRALAVEYARTPVTLNAVCPGFLETEMTERTIATIHATTKRTPEDARKFLEGLSPQRRLIQVDEVAHVVAMLCADEARGVNGQAIVIDGGQILH